MKVIDEMLRRKVAPAVDGLYRVGAAPLAVGYDGPGLSWFRIGPPLGVGPGAFEALDGSDEFDVWVPVRAVLPDGSRLCAGEETGHGSSGTCGWTARRRRSSTTSATP